MPPSADPAIFERLTSRHVDVLVVLAADVRRRQRIAARLGIGVSTISSHLHAVYELTGIHDADDLAAWWKEHRSGQRVLDVRDLPRLVPELLFLLVAILKPERGLRRDVGLQRLRRGPQARVV